MVKSTDPSDGAFKPPHPSRSIQRLAHLLDDLVRVPGTEYRFGLDSILGLVPLAGDFTGLVLGLPIVFTAIGHRFPKRVVLLMTVNVLLDAVLGTIPIAGNIFDFIWKPHRKNLRLLNDPNAVSGVLQEAGWKLKVAVGVLVFGAMTLLALFITLTRWFFETLVAPLG